MEYRKTSQDAASNLMPSIETKKAPLFSNAFSVWFGIGLSLRDKNRGVGNQRYKILIIDILLFIGHNKKVSIQLV
jgi:hypothetical protein